MRRTKDRMEAPARRWAGGAGLLLGLLLGALPACRQEAASTPGAPPAPQVGIITVVPQTVPDEPEFIGTAESSRPVEIRSQVTGILKARYFREGADVKKGDKLYLIDPVPFRAAMLSAKAKVAQAEARLVQARQDLARVKPLLAEQAVAQKDVDDAIAEELAAKAALDGAKADLVKAEFDLSNTLITAPIDGLIERTRVYEGRLVSAQTDLLTLIHQVDPMYVIVNAPESFLLKRRRDIEAKRIQHPGLRELRATLKFLDGSVYRHEGVLDLLDPALQTETGSRPVRVTFPNPDRILLPGQFVTVRFRGAKKTDAILIPQRAVQQGPNGSVVFVVDEGNLAQPRAVKATSWQGTQWLIEEGLRPGERVIVDGVQRVVPGKPVRPVPADEPGPAPAPATGPAPSPAPAPGQPDAGKEPAP
ncbi:efflux RND transporter periplasmic adaptor subunit [Nitrospira sp. Kam-Ns4a]